MTRTAHYTLRAATHSDLDFVYRIFVAIRSFRKIDDEDEEFKKIRKGFDPEQIGIIQYQGKDAGRLRVKYDARTINIGGLHLMPNFQRLGIGSAILGDLIAESEWGCHPITLEVHDQNKEARRLYERFGFRFGGYEYREGTGLFVRMARFPSRW